jgi:hypothetical protein
VSVDEILVAEADFAPMADLDAVRNRAWIVGALASALIVAGWLTAGDDPAGFYSSYLVGWLSCLSIALGLHAVGLLGHISGGDWAVVLRRVSEAAGRTLPFFALAALPLVFGLDHLYPWVSPEVDETTGHFVDHLLQHKRVYLNQSAFLIRGAVYFTVWSTIAFVLGTWSRRHDETGDPALRIKMKRLSALGLVLHVALCTLASVDWIMSLDPHWFSSLFGFVFVAGQALAAFAFAVLAVLFLSRRQPFAALIRGRFGLKIFHDYGKLMLAGVMFWGYMMISQYLIIWSGNLPEEITWYIDRNTNGWKAISLLLTLAHFALPFLLLLSADLKKKARLLALVALWVLAMRWLDFYWQVAPSVHHEGVAFGWLDPVVPIGIGGLWLGLLASTLKKGAVVPRREPALAEILAHG